MKSISFGPRSCFSDKPVQILVHRIKCRGTFAKRVPKLLGRRFSFFARGSSERVGLGIRGFFDIGQNAFELDLLGIRCKRCAFTCQRDLSPSEIDFVVVTQ